MTQDWQSVVDPNLVERLMRPLVQPGAIDSQLGNSILARTEQMTNHLPLLVQFAQRQVGVFQSEQIPIVYAQPSSSVQIVHSQTETATETTIAPLTIAQATLISNSTWNEHTSNPTHLSIGESRQETSNYSTSHSTNHLTNLSSGELRSELLVKTGSLDAIAVPSLKQPSSSQNPPIVYAQTISNEFNSDRSNQRFIVHPLTSENPKLQSSPKLADSRSNSRSQATPIRPVPPAPAASNSLPIIVARTEIEAPALPTITVHTGTEADSPTATWQTRTHLNETAATLPIVFAQPNPVSSSSQPASRTPPDLAQFSEFPSSFPPVTETFSSPPSPPPINLDTLTTQVERKILRRLVVESERRGQARWR